MRLSLMFGFLLVFGLVQGQKSEVLHQFFEFRDGIYLSHEALLENTPMIHFENEVKDLYINNSKILRVNPKNFGLSDSSTIHYIVFEGLPHLRVTRCCPDQVVYAGLTVVGALSLAVYESEVIVDIPMTAFNPYNGLPIYSGTVQREKNIQKIVVLNMETGKIWEADNAELMDLLQTDLLQIDDLEEIINRISDYNQINKINIKNTED